MADSSRRKTIEDILQSTIRKAQEDIQSDPSLQEMVDRLRTLYQEDREDFLFALGAAPPSAKKKKHPPVPPSRIPQLLFLLNAITSRGSISLPPSFRNRTSILPASLKNTQLDVVSTPSNSSVSQSVPISPARRPSQIQELQEIEKLDAQIEETQKQFVQIKKEESAILERKGKYAIAVERLKAERLLRELPSRISQLIHKKKLLEERIQSITPKSDKKP